MIDLPALPSLVVGSVHHRRHRPFVHDIDFRMYQWLVDVDHLPQRWPLATFRRSDHLGGHGGSWREEVLAAAAADGATAAPDDRVIMLTGARCFGHTFNPLTVYWCLAPDGSARWALLEIHNTYGGRHTQVVELGTTGRAQLDKEFYVSPFLTVDGRYDVRLDLDPERVGVQVNLAQEDRRILSASFRGRPRAATIGAVLRAALRTPLVMHQTTARIRLHGVWLWVRGLAVVPRNESPAGTP